MPYCQSSIFKLITCGYFRLSTQKGKYTLGVLPILRVLMLKSQSQHLRYCLELQCTPMDSQSPRTTVLAVKKLH